MILTDVLQTPILKIGTLLTSPEIARQRQVTSISVIEIPIDDFIRSGELVLSTGMNVGHDAKLLERFVREIARAGASSLAIAIGPHTPRLPKRVIEVADRVRLPLIELPWEARFSEISEGVLRLLIAAASKTKACDDFVWSLASRNIGEEAAFAQAKQFGLDIGRQFVGVVGKLSQCAAGPSDSTQNSARFVAGLCVGMAAQHRLQWIGTVLGDSVIGYLQVPRAKQRIEPLLAGIRLTGSAQCKISWGVGRVCKEFEDFAKSYEDARISCDLGIWTRGEGSVTDVSDVLAYLVLLNLQRDAHALMLLNRYIAPLSRFPRIPLLHTLEVFFDADCNASETARKLSISRQSLLYRLKRIESALNADLHDPDTRFAILFSLRLHKLQHYVKLRS